MKELERRRGKLEKRRAELVEQLGAIQSWHAVVVQIDESLRLLELEEAKVEARLYELDGVLGFLRSREEPRSGPAAGETASAKGKNSRLGSRPGEGRWTKWDFVQRFGHGDPPQ